MYPILQENSTREKILLILKKNPSMSITELSKEMNVTLMAIRQHLLILEHKGLVKHVAKAKKVGRPTFFYELTEKGENLFPKVYDTFMIDVFEVIEKHMGHKKIKSIFKWRQEIVQKMAEKALSSKKTFHDKVYGLKDFLEFEGHMLEVHNTNNYYTLKVFNCGIYQIATKYHEICTYEHQMFESLLGEGIKMKETLSKDNSHCTFIVPNIAAH
jgi:DeoR family suf operon transcriptional repressor